MVNEETNAVTLLVRRGLWRGGQSRLLARRRAGVVRRVRLRLRLGEQAHGGVVERRTGRREPVRRPWTPRRQAHPRGDVHVRVRRAAARGRAHRAQQRHPRADRLLVGQGPLRLPIRRRRNRRPLVHRQERMRHTRSCTTGGCSWSSASSGATACWSR